MKKNLINILIIVFLLAGASLLLYPAVSQHISARQSARRVADYYVAYKDLGDDKKEDLLAQADSYNARLAGIPQNFNGQTQADYDSILDITGTGIMGYITINKIGVELPIYHGVDAGVLQIGIGHLKETSLPVGGESTHSVLSGHRGLPGARLFTDLDKMEIGDEFSITVLDRVLYYRVDQIKVVLPTEVNDLLIEEGEDYCTLVTCTPYGINTHRLLVRGVRTRVDDGYKQPAVYVPNEALKIDPTIVATVIAVPMFVVVIIVSMVLNRKRDKGHANKK